MNSSKKEIWQFAEVILPFPLQNSFTYRIGIQHTLHAECGKRVLVQFGKTKIYTGIILELHNRTPEKYKAKEIIDILDEVPVIYPVQIEFWKWMADYYCCSLGEVMAVALPSSMKLESESVIVINDDFSGEITYLGSNEMTVIEALDNKKELSIKDIQDITGLKNVFPVIKSLYQQGVILSTEKVTEAYKPKQQAVIILNQEYNDESKLSSLFRQLEKSPRQLDTLIAYNFLKRQSKYVLLKDIAEKASVKEQIIKAMVKKEIFLLSHINMDRFLFEKTEKEDFELTSAQETVLKKIEELHQERECVLLHGVTNSGKTHIYMKLIEKYLERGQQVLYLVPEIALTAQLIRKLQACFGGQTGIYHSRYNPNERYEIWHKTLHGEYNVVLGVRSALFLPFKDLGLIVIDEEHENTFKQVNPAPRYQARDAAIMYANILKSKVLLGSATPSMESYHNAMDNKFGYIALNERYNDVLPPEVILADIADDLRKKKMKGHLTSVLFNEINECLERQRQSILFLNRRGYAPYIECKTCGWIPDCKHCDISLTYHKFSRKLNCHYCGYKIMSPSACGVCGNSTLIMKGFGTEKIEDDVELLFPDTNFMRMDTDTTRSKEAFKKMITAFEKGQADIMIGTQMVTKGLDFERVSLVGILNADQMINYPDFRALERSYQLMAQVSGRAGRRKERGKVVIQTYKTKHPIFQFLINNDFQGFYEMELKNRIDFNYPPLSKLIRIKLRTMDLDLLNKGSSYLALRLKTHFGQRLIGPEFPPVMRIRNEYYKEMIIKFEKKHTYITQSKQKIMDEISRFNFEPQFRKIRCVVDVDP